MRYQTLGYSSDDRRCYAEDAAGLQAYFLEQESINSKNLIVNSIDTTATLDSTDNK
jgi:hypothetical protein